MCLFQLSAFSSDEQTHIIDYYHIIQVLSEDGSTTINDWMFLEEINAVNIVVQTTEGKFIVFQQRKYAIPGVIISPVGGFIDEGESPLTAAKREVVEELGMGSRGTLEKVKSLNNPNRIRFPPDVVIDAIARTALPDEIDPTTTAVSGRGGGLSSGRIPPNENDPDWVFLGRYRTAANRGGGFLYSYLLKNAIPISQGSGNRIYGGRSGDDESQKILYLSQEEVFTALSEGKFQEVKWAATFALSLLHLKDGMPGCCTGDQYYP